MKTLTQECPELTITIKQDQADYTLLFDREAKDVFRKDSKIAVFNKAGDLIHTSSTRSVGNVVKNACKFIRQDVVQGRP